MSTLTTQTTPSIASAFANGKAFIPFITCGDPSLDTTAEIVRAMADAGADLIELGIPFSDPTAEGPVIQAANERALSAGTTTDKVFDMVQTLREEGLKIPLVFMTYANVVFSYGTERFCNKAAEVGVQGIILPDVPFEERGDFVPACEAADIALIPMIAPTSENRIAAIAAQAAGFIYVVSSLGVTGTRSSITTNIEHITRHIKQVTDVPCAVGFGISTPEQAAAMAGQSDGAIVGSAIVKIIAEKGKNAAQPVAEYVSSVKEALRAL